MFPTLWVPPAVCQHLPSLPNFCAGQLCIGSGPVVNSDKLNYPTFLFSKKNGLQSEYLVKYLDFGYIKLTMNSVERCARNNKKSTYGIPDDAPTFRQKWCHVMPNGKPYVLEMSLHGNNSSTSRSLCNQAFDGLWFLDSFSSSQDQYKPTYTKLDLTLRCVK
jgi:hypothetical protein